MIGREMSYEAAESRPLIVRWLTTSGYLFSGLLLAASVVALLASLKQIKPAVTHMAVLPTGAFYPIHGFKKREEAIALANDVRLNTPPIQPQSKR